MLNLVVSKLTAAPQPKSRAAFIREYELSVIQLKFNPDTATKEWYDTLLQLQITQEKNQQSRIDKAENPHVAQKESHEVEFFWHETLW